MDFNPEKWADATKKAGMKYVVFTTKHHDGFAMFDTQESDYKITSPKTPFSKNPKEDVRKEIFNTFRNQNFKIGAYFSKPDWNTEYYWWPYFPTTDRNINYNPNKYPDAGRNTKTSPTIRFRHQGQSKMENRRKTNRSRTTQRKT